MVYVLAFCADGGVCQRVSTNILLAKREAKNGVYAEKTTIPQFDCIYPMQTTLLLLLYSDYSSSTYFVSFIFLLEIQLGVALAHFPSSSYSARFKYL